MSRSDDEASDSSVRNRIVNSTNSDESTSENVIDHSDQNRIQPNSLEDGYNENTRRNGAVLQQVIWTELFEEMRTKLTVQFVEQLNHTLKDFVERATQREDGFRAFQWHSDYMVDKRLSLTSKNSKNLSTKLFRQRDSVLTQLLELSHIRTVYHMFIAILVLFSINAICHDFLDDNNQSPMDHVVFFRYAFGGLREVVLFWIQMFVATLFIPFLGFLFWCTRRPTLRNPIILDWIMLLSYVLYQIAFMIIPIRFILQHDLPPASTTIVAMEQIRMFMKTHAFVRSSVDKAFKNVNFENTQNRSNESNSSQSDSAWLPDFSHYLYFLFAPTLVYRESYPRTNEIRWSYVVSNLTQVCGCILLSYYILVRFCFTEFAHFGHSADHTFRRFILTCTATSLPGGLVMLLTFFAALHSWLNAFAEMLRFGDRLFYKDWWNSTTFSSWYRTWNVVVHDWLYAYLYKDIQIISDSRRSRFISVAVVFWLSALVHEYVLSIAFRFFYPVLFVFFTFAGYPFIYLKGSGRGWNVFIWVALFSGWGQMLCLYSIEWYARRNCEPVFGSWIDFVIPHSWFCRPIQSAVP